MAEQPATTQETTIDWTQFTRRIYIKAPIQKVYDAWALPGQINTWFFERATYNTPDGTERGASDPIQPGDTYEWKWYHWDGISRGTIHAANGSNHLNFDFAGGLVDITLEEDRGMTHLKLVQTGIQDDDQGKLDIYNGCSIGWSFWMVNLKAWLEHGVTLNDKEGQLTTPREVVNC